MEFDFADDGLQPENCLVHSSWLVPSQYKSAEVAKGAWEVVAASPPWAVDAWGLGCLIHEVFTGELLRSIQDLR